MINAAKINNFALLLCKIIKKLHYFSAKMAIIHFKQQTKYFTQWLCHLHDGLSV